MSEAAIQHDRAFSVALENDLRPDAAWRRMRVVSECALAQLLIEKGVFTEDEWHMKMADIWRGSPERTESDG